MIRRIYHYNHGLDETVTFKVEADPTGQGPWIEFMEIEVSPGETYDYIFSRSISGQVDQVQSG